MKLCIKNIGKIEDAEIEINGITVIGGENDTGKSTVAKALFSIFSSFYEIQRQIYKERYLSLENIVRILEGYPLPFSSDQFKEYDAFVDDIILNAESYIKSPDLLEKRILDLVIGPNDSFESLFIEDILDRIKRKNFVGQIIEILQIPDEVILNSIVNKILSAEFSGQLLNVDSQVKGSISLQIQNEELSISVSEDFASVNGLVYSLHTEAIYIDDPFILDKISFRRPQRKNIYADHQDHLISKFFSEHFYTSVIDEIIVLLNQEFGVNILLNTHSPYFLRAIQVYSAKYKRNDVCKYYLSELDEKGMAHMTDVTNNVDRIFAKLAEPLQALEDERCKIEND